jgi:drug/metabolite transporter (DMT)-like permease
MSVISNILLIESMRFQSAGISSTIFRLNMVLVVIGGFLLFDEPVTVQLVIGIFAAALAIIAFIPRGSDSGSSDVKKARLGFAMALVACLLRALMALCYKGAFSHGSDVNVVSVATGVCWIIGGPVFSLLREHRITLPSKGEWFIGTVSGVLVCGILFFMARMNECGNASVVNPIAQMSFLGTFVLSVLFLHEKMTRKKLLALLLGCAAIVCLTMK